MITTIGWSYSSLFFIKCIDKQRKIIYNINKGGDNVTHEDRETNSGIL